MTEFTEQEIEAAKKIRDEIIKEGSIYSQSIYMAGEVCMWDELSRPKPKQP